MIGLCYCVSDGVCLSAFCNASVCVSTSNGRLSVRGSDGRRIETESRKCDKTGTCDFWNVPADTQTNKQTNKQTDRQTRVSQYFTPIQYIVVTGPPTHSVGNSIVFLVGVCRRLLSSVVVCATQRRASRPLYPRRPGDDVMPPPV